MPSRNPLSIQVCFNPREESHDTEWDCVVIPYQFRSVSIHKEMAYRLLPDMRRNPLSIQVCFNNGKASDVDKKIFGRNPLSIQVCFNVSSSFRMTPNEFSRNPLSIQVCFNDNGDDAGWELNQVVIPYQFRSVSMRGNGRKHTRLCPVVIPYQFRSVSIT